MKRFVMETENGDHISVNAEASEDEQLNGLMSVSCYKARMTTMELGLLLSAIQAVQNRLMLVPVRPEEPVQGDKDEPQF